MKKIYTYLGAVCLLWGVSTKADAVTLTLTEDAVTMDGYEQTSYYNFQTGLTADPTIGTDYVVNDANVWMYPCTTTGFESFYFQSVTYNGGGYWWRGGDNYGYLMTQKDRSFGIGGMKEGQRLVMQLGTTGSAGVVPTIQSMYTDGEGNSVPNCVQDSIGADGFYYYTMLADGRLDIKLVKQNYIVAIAVFTNADAAEYVTAPSLSLTKVQGNERLVSITSGTSSKGNTCVTYYNFNGEDPIFRDADGNPAPVDNMYGDWLYEEGNTVSTNEAPDKEEGNMVTISAVTVSSTGVCSEVTKGTYSVDNITLNSPTLSLVNLDGIGRTYQVGWVDNTLCGEACTISYSTGDGLSGTVEPGGTIVATKGPIDLVVTEANAGYEDGITTLATVEQEGTSYYKKNTEAEHDWDFVNLTDEMLKKLQGMFVIGTHKEEQEVTKTDEITGETTTVTEMVDVDDYGYYNWYYTSAKNRANLDLLKADTTYTYTDKTDADGNLVYNADGTVAQDTTMNTSCQYAEDGCNLLNGLTISNAAPYVSSSGAWSSQIFIYTNGGGLWITAKPTVNVPGTTYGDYVVYNNAGSTGCTMATGESTDLVFGSNPYIYYIDIYTTDNPPSGVESITVPTESTIANVYTIDGRLIRSRVNVDNATNGLPKGIYIVNGKKIAVK